MLLDPVVVSSICDRADFAGSHGDTGDHHGVGPLYWLLPYSLRAKRCVCLGSGGLYVPRWMAQAQRDCGTAATGSVILVDAQLEVAPGWGKPSWVNSPLLAAWPEIHPVHALAEDRVLAASSAPFEYLHIDADHRYETVRQDLAIWLPQLAEGGLVTVHDTLDHAAGLGVRQALLELLAARAWSAIEFPVAAGTVVLQRRRIG